MSERGLRLVAVGSALIAVALAATATVVTLTREPSAPAATAAPAKLAAPTERNVMAADVVRLRLDTVATAGDGVRVTDTELAKALGLEPGDVLLALSGRTLHRALDLSDAMLGLSMMSVTTVYADVQHDGDRVLVAWRLDGDLRSARMHDYPRIVTPSGPSDPLASTVHKVDDTHVTMPAATADQLVAPSAPYVKAVRGFSSYSSGVARGVRIYAVRPDTIMEAIGLRNGDVVRGVNGDDISSIDELATKLASTRASDAWTIDIERRHVAMQLTISIK